MYQNNAAANLIPDMVQKLRLLSACRKTNFTCKNKKKKCNIDFFVYICRPKSERDALNIDY